MRADCRRQPNLSPGGGFVDMPRNVPHPHPRKGSEPQTKCEEDYPRRVTKGHEEYKEFVGRRSLGERRHPPVTSNPFFLIRDPWCPFVDNSLSSI
jgi:hypothetical protein